MELKFILESILFSAQQPLSPKELRDVLAGAAEHTEDSSAKALKKTSFEAITAALEELASEHEQAQRTFRLACVAGSAPQLPGLACIAQCRSLTRPTVRAMPSLWHDVLLASRTHVAYTIRDSLRSVRATG